MSFLILTIHVKFAFLSNVIMSFNIYISHSNYQYLLIQLCNFISQNLKVKLTCQEDILYVSCSAYIFCGTEPMGCRPQC